MPGMNQSRIKMFRRCQKQYSFRYDYGPKYFDCDESNEMVPKKKKVQLHRGTWLHALQQAHNLEWAKESGFKIKNLVPWQEVHASFCAEYDQLFDEEKEEYGDLPFDCERLFKGYLRFWRKEADQYRVAALHDGSPAIEFIVEHRLPKIAREYPFKGRLDLMVEDVEYGGLWIRDAKWVKSIPDDDERMMSPQNCMYVWCTRKMDYDIRGFIYDYGRTKAPAIPRVLKNGTLSVAQRMDTDYYTYVRAIKELHGDMWKDYAKAYYIDKLRTLKDRDVLWYRRERIPVEDHKVKQALIEFVVSVRDIQRRSKHAPRSYFYNCRWGCEYHSLCTAEFAGLDIEPLVLADFTTDEERYGEVEDLLKD
jgi:PD-(D/E)XK nuclease superfamily